MNRDDKKKTRYLDIQNIDNEGHRGQQCLIKL